MPAPLFDLDGLLRGDAVLTIEEALDHATADPVRGVLVPMLDVLALARIDADAEVLMVLLADGFSQVFRIADLVDRSDVHLQLSTFDPQGALRTAWTARLRTDEAAPAAPVRSIRAMSFASFVGLS
jgi:hypothetical protein